MAAVILTALLFFYQLMQWPLLPKFVDIYYHLGVVKAFSDAGGWVLRDTWELAPGGRPHLYPPLLHLLLLIPYRLGMPVIEIARLVDVLSYPALLAAFWWFVRARAGSRAAFWAMFLFSTVYTAYLSSVTLPAFNLGMIGALAALHFLASGRAAAAGLAAAAVCYTHTMAAAMLAGMGAVAACLDPAVRKPAWRALAIAAALSLPMWAWLAANYQSFAMTASPERRTIEWDPLIYGLAAVRLVRTLRCGKPDTWPLALFLGMAPALPFRQARVLGGYGVLAAAWLAALEILSWFDALSRRRGPKACAAAAAAVVLFFGLLAPTCLWQTDTGRLHIQAMDRTLSRCAIPDPARNFRAKGFSIYFEKEYAEMAAVLESRLAPDELFWTDFPHAGGILYLMTGRAMSTAMLGEVGNWGDRPARIQNAKLLLWFKNADGLASGEAPALIESLKLKPVADTSLAFIFENPSGGARAQTPRAAVSLIVLWGLLAVWAAALLICRRAKKV